MRNILITGGAGFIGSHLVRHFVRKYPQYNIYNLDALTYAGNLENLRDIESSANYTFLKADIADATVLERIFEEMRPEGVIHLAAESHVDRSILNPEAFVIANITGTVNLLSAFRKLWGSEPEGKRFYHISTDEVYGSLGKEGFFTEETPYDPRSPYSASKASSDHFVRAFHHTYKLPVVISNCSNNYGPYQFPEKLIPLIIHNIQKGLPLPVYGQGLQIRDWLFVGDHVEAIDVIFHKGETGSTYNIGGENEWRNIDLVHLLCTIMDSRLGRAPGTSAGLITYVKDRAGHDMRYAIDAAKLKDELGWRPAYTFEKGLELTVDWYLQNAEWLEGVVSGQYLQYYQKQYSAR